jgi:hypothetical protein
MPFNQSEPDAAEVQKWFLDNPKVPDQTFELALVLGGTVSAGAYTAGALDFLIEALDCWEAARAGADPPCRGIGSCCASSPAPRVAASTRRSRRAP